MSPINQENIHSTALLTEQAALYYYGQLQLLLVSKELDITAKNFSLYRLMGVWMNQVTEKDKIPFHTTFTQLSYIGHRHNLPTTLIQSLQLFRRQYERGLYKAWTPQQLLDTGVMALVDGTFWFSQVAVSDALVPLLESLQPKSYDFAFTEKIIAKCRVTLLDEDIEQGFFIGESDLIPGERILIRYNVPHYNEGFGDTVRLIRSKFGFPVSVNLLDCKIAEDQFWIPAAIVVEPDFLIDISAIAALMDGKKADPNAYLLYRFMPKPDTDAILMGNIANFLLDELLSQSETSFKDLFLQFFLENPLYFIHRSDKQVVELSRKAQLHYTHLYQMVKYGFAKQGLHHEDAIVEPSFLSETYGIQGRLDVLFKSKDSTAIVELKSGKVYNPNAYGLSNSHYMQTLLYDLMVKEVYGEDTNITNYILYSAIDVSPLRYAPPVKSLQMEAIQVRNTMVQVEYWLARSYAGKQSYQEERSKNGLFAGLRTHSVPHWNKFRMEDMQRFEAAYAVLDERLKLYFDAFCGFIAREQIIARVGHTENDQLNGHSGLWRDPLIEKEQRYDILRFLEITDNQLQEKNPTITLQRPKESQGLSNFRVGDIVILYPEAGDAQPVLRHQLYKGSLLEISKERLVIQLRYRQFNLRDFDDQNQWAIEHDHMDHSFMGMYRNLFDFAAADKSKQALWLGIAPPPPSSEVPIVSLPAWMTSKQQAVFQRIIASNGYYLLWGPPGTGKTSVLLAQLARHYFYHTKENIVLLAFTNRAVDEICEAVLQMGSDVAAYFMRVGSAHGSAIQYRSQLMDAKIAHCTTRKEILSIFQQQRIIVSTVASFQSRQTELASLELNRLMIDEASQLIEPALMGMVSNFKHVLMIGDHQQLPAVVVQSSEESKVDLPELTDMGLHNLRNSLFERLYLRAQAQGWTWAYGQLNEQGRMHKDIMAYPNAQFYGHSLDTLTEQQQGDLTEQLNAWPFDSKKRVVFCDVATDFSSLSGKIHPIEANKIVDLIALLHGAGKIQSAEDVGIITPYRSQIATILSALEERGLLELPITVDTVERYQGGARKIIILGLCLNHSRQLDHLVSLSEQGVDRKFNVALTRAKERLIVFGNKEIMAQVPHFKAFVEAFEEVEKR